MMKTFRPEDYIYYEKRLRQLDRRAEITDSIFSVLRRIIYTPLGIFFHLVTFISRIVGAIASVLMLVGLYYAYSSFVAWKNHINFGNDAKVAIALILFPFIAYAVAVVSEKAWDFFENNAY